MINQSAKEQLKAIIERIERLEEEKKATADDISAVYAEAKSNGFEVAVLRAIIRLRKQDADKLREFEEILATYRHALGMLPPDDNPRKSAEAHIERMERRAARHD